MGRGKGQTNFSFQSLIMDFRLMFQYRELAVLNFAILVSMIGFGLIVPFLSIYAQDFGASDTEVGMMVGVFALARVATSPLGGWMADRVGRKPSMVFGMLMYCVVMFLFGIARNVPELFLYRGLQGAASGLVWPVAMTYVGDVVPEEDRSKAMALFSITFATGMAVGPILGGVISNYYSLNVAFFFTAVISLASAVLLFFFLKESHSGTRPEHKQTPWENLKGMRLSALTRDPGTFLGVSVGAFSLFFGSAAVYAMLPIFAKDKFELEDWHIGLVFALMGLVQALVMFPAGSLGDRIGKTKILLVGSFTAAVFCSFLGTAQSFLLLLMLVAFYVLGRSMVQPLFPAIISSLTAKETRGRAMGIYTLAQNLAFFLGSGTGGYVSQEYGREFTFPMAGVVGLIGALILLVTVKEYRLLPPAKPREIMK